MTPCVGGVDALTSGGDALTWGGATPCPWGDALSSGGDALTWGGRRLVLGG